MQSAAVPAMAEEPGDDGVAPKQRPRSQMAWRWIAAALAVAAIVIGLGLRVLPDGRLHVYFLDVGQGDATLIRAPDGRQILVDGGPGPTALLNELGDVLPFWDRSLDLVLLTHPDADHLAGLLPLLERYRVDRVLEPPGTAVAPEAAAWEQTLHEKGVPRGEAARGMRLLAGGLALAVLNPPEDVTGDAATPNNDSSIVLRLDYGGTSLLLTGDAEMGAEAAMLAAGLPLRADVLKVSHHGSDGSTSAPFLAAVSPSVAIVQVGAGNRYGLPAPALLDRLAGIRAYRTDQNGRIEIISDGTRLWVKPERPSP
jgi:competence protein ComEC